MTETPKRQDRIEPEQIREITQIVLSVLKEWQAEEKPPVNRFFRTMDWLNDHWALIAFLIAGGLSLFYFSLAWHRGVDFMHPVTQIVNEQTKYKQEQKEYAEREKNGQLIQRIVKLRVQCGNDFLNTGLHGEAKQEFEAALKLDKTNMEAQLGLLKSRVFELSQGEYNPAVINKRIKFIEEETKTENKKADPHACLFRGTMHYVLKEYDKAEKNFKKALELDNTIASAHYNLGLIYDQQKEKAAALKEFKAAAALSEWNRSYLNNLACEYYENGYYDKSIKQHKKVIVLDPGYLLSYAEISRSQRLSGNFKDSEKNLRILLRKLESEIGLSKKNSSPWYFMTAKGNKISLYSLKEKQCYTYYNLAVTVYLERNKTQARVFVNQAPKLSPYNQLNVLYLIKDEISLLGTKQPQYRDLTGQLQQELLPQMQRQKSKAN
jgi:tetratricopeptide (TPR) repeat protein